MKYFLVFTILLNLLLNCAGKEQNARDIDKEFQNGEDDIEIFVDSLKISNQKNKFGQLKNRVVVVNGKTVVGGEEKEGKLAKHFIPYASGGDWGPYEFEGTYGAGTHTHVVQTAHRQPGYGIRRTLLKRRLRRLLRQLGTSGRKRPFLRKAVPVLPLPIGDEDPLKADESSFEGSYVAVSGRPGSRTVHVVNGRGGVNLAGTVSRKQGIYVGGKRYRPVNAYGKKSGRPWINGPLGGIGNRGLDGIDSYLGYGGDIDDLETTVFGYANSGRKKPNYFLTDHTDDIGYSPLPRCSYINTDFVGDDVGDGKGISTGSAINCKQACQNSESCKFYSYRDGWARDCYLKRGRRGDPNPQSAIPKIGFISGTKGNDDCLCLPNGADTSEEICPVRSTRPIYPWKKKGTKNRDKSGNDGTFRFDYDDYDYFNRLGGEDGIDPGVRSRGNVRGSVENLPDEDDSDVEPVTRRTTGGRRSGGRRDRNRGRGQLSKDDNTEIENKEEINDVGLLREEIENKIEDKVKRLESNDEEGEDDIEFYDVE